MKFSIILIMVLGLSFIFGVSSVECKRKPNKLRDDYKCHPRSIQNKKNRKLCRKIMKSPFLEESFLKLKQLKFKSSKPECPKTPKRVCPTFKNENLQNKSTLGERSLSPYQSYINCDENRIPRFIMEQRCLCDFCLNKSGDIDRSLASQEITTEIYVLKLKEGTNDSEPRWEKKKESVVVGCTCAFPYIVLS